MMEINLLGSSLLNGFLKGKHFNRCLRFTPLIIMVFEILHFNSSLEIKNTAFMDDAIQEVTENMLNNII